MAQWLVHNFAPQMDCLFLLARNRPKSQHFWQTLEEMRQLYRCHVELILADVANIQQMEQLFQRFFITKFTLAIMCPIYRPEMRRLNGLIHSAGFLLNAPMAAMDPPAMANILEAKAGGALILTSLLDKFKLEPSHFIINSSLASLHPSPGQSVYAATNALCDALIQRRRAEGRVGTTLNWANWLQVGLWVKRVNGLKITNFISFLFSLKDLLMSIFRLEWPPIVPV
jgi:short-subunit dehydrogenase